MYALATGHPDAWLLKQYADSARVPPVLVWAVAYQESEHNLNPALRGHHCAKLPTCEVGRFQILPSTAKVRCPDLNVFIYRDNIKCGVRYLRYWYDVQGSWEEAVRAYQCPKCKWRTPYEKDVMAIVGRFELRLGRELP